MVKKETILIFGSHSDDEVIGRGGTIAKYAKEGKKVITVLFSKGDKSSPWLKEEYLVELRKIESEKVGKYVGKKETIILGLEDGKLQEEVKKKGVKKRVEDIIKKYKPSRIFVHSKNDVHPDHKAVNKCVFEILDKIDSKKKISVFVYEVWNVLNETRPRLYVDVTDTFSNKINAMKKFKSQWLYIYILIIPVILRAFICGLHAHCRFAERFYKVR